MARSPLQPFVIRVTRQHHPDDASMQQSDTYTAQNDVDGQVDNLDDIDMDEAVQSEGKQQPQNGAGLQAAAVQLTFKPDPGAVNAEQLADVVQVSSHDHVA